jgi:hypothetical protein
VAELVGIDDRADDLDPAVEHVQRQDVYHPTGGFTGHRARLAGLPSSIAGGRATRAAAQAEFGRSGLRSLSMGDHYRMRL